MSLFHRFFTSLLLLVLSAFFSGISFAFAGETEKNIFIIPPGFLASCIEDIQCEQIGENLYDCRIDGAIDEDRSVSSQNLSIGKIDPIIKGKRWTIINSTRSCTIPKKIISSHEVYPYVYPFVRITKIQV